MTSWNKETQAAKDAVMKAMKADADAKQAEADKAAKLAQKEAKTAEANRKWGGIDPEGRISDDSTVYGKAIHMARPAHGYDTYNSTMSELVAFAILLNQAITADITVGSDLLNSGLGLGSAAWKSLNEKVRGDGTKDAILKLPESIIKSSSCNENGVLTFDCDLPNTPPPVVEKLKDMYESNMKAFLKSHEYSKNEQGQFCDKAGQPLNRTKFSELINDSNKGLAASLEKYRIELTKESDPVVGEKPTPFPFGR